MGAWLAAVVLLLAAATPLPAPAPAPAAPAAPVFADTLPPGIADVSGWEVISGDFETPQMRGGYRFYVNPERLAMYQLMRYRVQRLPSATQPGDAALGAERVAFIRRPGVREPIDCWERRADGADDEWRAFAPATAEYVAEMTVLMQVLAIHRAARAAY
jgi:hypothetical protein